MLVILVSIILFGIDSVSSGIVRSYARTTGSLLWAAAGSAIATVDQSGIVRTHSSLAEENASLRYDLAMMTEKAARIQALEAENESLRALAALAETEVGGVTARVLSTFRVSPYGTFLIGAGSRDGIEVGNIVLTPGGFILGTVSDIDTHTATIEALFAPSKEIDVVVRDVAFTVTGRGGGNARGMIARDVEVSLEDTVRAPAYRSRPAGIIGSIESASSSASQTLSIRVPTNLDTLSFVYVVPHE